LYFDFSFVGGWFAPGRLTAQLPGWASLPCAHTNRRGFDIGSDVPWFQWGIRNRKPAALSSYAACYGDLERRGGKESVRQRGQATTAALRREVQAAVGCLPGAPRWLATRELRSTPPVSRLLRGRATARPGSGAGIAPRTDACAGRGAFPNLSGVTRLPVCCPSPPYHVILLHGAVQPLVIHSSLTQWLSS